MCCYGRSILFCEDERPLREIGIVGGGLTCDSRINFARVYRDGDLVDIVDRDADKA